MQRARDIPVPRYAELGATSNYSFLCSGAHPEELVECAAALGLAAIGIADRNSLAGVVRAHVAARNLAGEGAEIRLLVGARLTPLDGPELLCYPRDRAAYGRLCRLLTRGKRRVEKGDCHLTLEEILEAREGQLLLFVPPDVLPDDLPRSDFAQVLSRFAAAAPGDVYLLTSALYRGDEANRLPALATLAEASGAPLVAWNDAALAVPEAKPLLDVVTCIREGVTLDEAGFRLAANAERHLKSPAEMAHLFRRYPEALARTLEIAARCRFSLDDLSCEYPSEIGFDGTPAQKILEREAWRGARRRYPEGIPEEIARRIRYELALVAELDYARYFLTVYDIVCFARARGILYQGRGSAANSTVCYCLGITAVDPQSADLLFERFVSTARNEPPDIDVDFEHERREEVIQYIYQKYGRERAGLTAIVICYRRRSALREVGKALGLSADSIHALSSAAWGWGREGPRPEQVREVGLDPEAPRIALTLTLARALIGFPRHLSQHVGGFVITAGPLESVVPIENAAMPERTVIEWDKDSLDALDILKVDVLGLGMLTCIRKAFELLKRHYDLDLTLDSIPAEDPAVYEMLGRADSLGVFQVESRAQMSMLPRLKPKNFYDLVIEVAIVRPGPIQGDMVHPYLRRREKREPVDYPSDELRAVLSKTLGVPLFQEQAMKIAIVAAGFTPNEADRLRRAMATFRHAGTIHTFRGKFIEGMVKRGYERAFAERCFQQIAGFGDYGFPESHAASFALLVYVSSWLKCHYPAVFAAALLNSQPMGFYAPAQIVRDAREHGVEVRPPDVNASDWDCTLEPASGGAFALRLGLRHVKGMGEEPARALVAARGAGYPDPLALWRMAGVPVATLEALARADAFASLGLSRREALWAAKGLPEASLPLFAAARSEERGAEPAVTLPTMALGEQVVEDYLSLQLSLKAHPLSFLRGELGKREVVPAARLPQVPDGAAARVAGLVLVRQRPGSASGVIFATLEDETGIANVIVWPSVFERCRRALLGASLLLAEGRLQKEGLVIHLIAEQLVDLTGLLHRLKTLDRDAIPASASAPGKRTDPLPSALARVDEVKRPPRDLAAEAARRSPLSIRSRDFH